MMIAGVYSLPSVHSGVINPTLQKTNLAFACAKRIFEMISHARYYNANIRVIMFASIECTIKGNCQE